MVILLILFFSPVIILLVHIMGARLFRKVPPQIMAFRSVIAAMIPVGAALWFFALSCLEHVYSTVTYCFICYGSLGYTYFHFFNMSETARRIKILYEIDKAGCLSEAGVTALYRTTDIISIRLRRLVETGQLESDGTFYRVSGRSLYWAGHMIILWRNLLNLSGEDA